MRIQGRDKKFLQLISIFVFTFKVRGVVDKEHEKYD